MEPNTDHQWPAETEAHFWSEWTAKTGIGGIVRPTQSRRCVHPRCGAYEEREAPRA